jgi:integrase
MEEVIAGVAGETHLREHRYLDARGLVALWRELERLETWEAEPGTGARGRPLSQPLIRAVRLLILTGQRRGEVIGAEAAELALGSKAMWTIPSDRTKNGLLQRVPLPLMASFEFRRALSEASSSRFAFPSPDDADKHIRADAVTKALKRVCKRIGLDGIAPHDLRRTVGTGLAMLRVPKEVRSLVINHTRERGASETTRVYDRHDYDDEKLEALVKWEAHLRKVLGLGSADNITSLRADGGKSA